MNELKVNGDQAIIIATRAIVIHALKSGVGSKLITNSQLADEYNIAAGTTQRALSTLSKSGALVTKSKGHLGRIIINIRTDLCWSIAKLDPVQLIMPSRGSIEIDIITRKLMNHLGFLKIPYFIDHAFGGEKRIQKTIDGEFDITLVSHGAFENMDRNIEECQVKVMPPDTYYSSDRVVIVKRKGEKYTNPIKVGIDRESSDHTRITLGEFPESSKFEYIEVDYRTIPVRILKNEIDMGVWHVTTSPVPLELSGLCAERLKKFSSIETHNQLSAAALVCNPGRPELIALINEIDVEGIALSQRKAIDEEDPYTKAFELIE